MSDPKRNIEGGKRFPYDSDSHGSSNAPQGWQYDAARGILYDFSDRRGVKDGFNRIDLETRQEIVKSMVETIELAFSQSLTDGVKKFEEEKKPSDSSYWFFTYIRIDDGYTVQGSQIIENTGIHPIDYVRQRNSQPENKNDPLVLTGFQFVCHGKEFEETITEI